MKRVVITGMSVTTPIGDTLEGFITNLLAGSSAIGRGRLLPEEGSPISVIGSLVDYDYSKKVESLRDALPGRLAMRMLKLVGMSPWVTKLSLLSAVDAFIDSGLISSGYDEQGVAVIVAGNNINDYFKLNYWRGFHDSPPLGHSIDVTFGIKEWDSDHCGCIAETLQLFGPSYTVGGACASGAIAMRSALAEIRGCDYKAALITSPITATNICTIQSLVSLGAIAPESNNIKPGQVSRPFDRDRNGIVLCHGGASILLEELDHALNRGANIYAEVLSVAANSNATRSPTPSVLQEARVMDKAISLAQIDKGSIDFISAHATSTVQGDLAEINAIKQVFGEHSYKLKINAPKSMLGHTCWASALVEIVAALMQMRVGMLHPSINIDALDPKIDLDVCAGGSVRHQIGYMIKNSFGFGGINSSCVIKRYD